MPRYFFHLATEVSYSVDEDGLYFEDLDAAYLDACRAAMDMSVQMLRAQQDPGRCRFDVADDAGAILLDIPFLEVMRIRPSRSLASNHAVNEELQSTSEELEASKEQLPSRQAPHSRI